MRRERKARPDARVRARAEELAQQGMPYQMAMAVAHGKMDLNEALERMARRDRVNVLMERHQLSRALATQIAIGHADLEQILARRRLAEHRAENRERTCLQPEVPLALALHGNRLLKGKVTQVDPYTFQFAEGDAEPTEIHKLEVKFSYDPADWKKVKKGVRQNKRQTERDTPAVHPQDRYSCSDRRLFSYLDRGVEVVVTLLDGDILRGRVAWFGRYEFGLILRTEVEVTIFRHALKNLSAAS